MLLLSILHLSCGELTSFSLNLYKVIAKANADENCVISPSSIAMATGLVYYGANGETRTQIERAMGDVDFEKLTQKIADDSSIESVNKLLVASDFSVKKTYLEATGRIFNTTADSVYFDDKRTVGTVNNWVEKATHGYIKNLVQSFEPDTAAVIINAMYFKATWKHPFVAPGIKIFFDYSTSRRAKIPIMLAKANFSYANFDTFQALELPYNNTDVTMLIILPKEIEGLRALEEVLKTKDLKKILSVMSTRETTVSMPRFKVEFSESLNDVFKEVRKFY